MAEAKEKKGFTLIELLLVIGVIGVIALFGWLNLYKVGSHQELGNTKRSIVALLRDAQQRSITQVDGEYWGVRFENSAKDQFLLVRSASLTELEMGGGAKITVVPLKRPIEFRQPPEGVNKTIIFSQISGFLISPNCPSQTFNEEVAVGVIDDPQNVAARIYCNGVITFD